MRYSVAQPLFMLGNKATGKAIRAPGLSDHNESEFTMAAIDSKVLRKHDLPHDGVVNFVSRVKNVCDGVGAILALAYEHEGERLAGDGIGSETTIDMLKMESLMTLARASMDLMEREADHIERWAFERHTDAGVIQTYRSAKATVEHRGLSVPMAER